MKDKILVTGGAGFIGSRISKRLIDEGFEVVVLDNFSRSTRDDLRFVLEDRPAGIIDGDIRYPEVVRKAIRGCTYVFHEAATNINRSIKYPDESFDVNWRGSYNVFNAALENEVDRVIFASSASVYGSPQKLPMSETDDTSPITPYCVSKLAGEYLLRFLSKSELKYNALRYFNVYGKRQKTDAYYTSVINIFIKKILARESPTIDGLGSQTMDFVNVNDVVQANILAMNSNSCNEIFNVGSGVSTSIKDLAEMIIDIIGSDVKPEFKDREVLVTNRRADTSKSEKVLGFKASTNLSEGLEELIDDIRKHPELY